MSADGLHIDIEKRFDEFRLIVNAALPASGVTAIFGANGSGKTSLLRLLAGFERPDRGRIAWSTDKVWADVPSNTFLPPHRRRVGCVLQGGQLISHLSVAGNLAFVEKRAVAHTVIFTKPDILEVCDLGPLLEKKPGHLSGGERQRVAFALALLSQPHLLLLDEPFSAIDRARKQIFISYLDGIRRAFDLPVIFVSHDVSEISRIADQVLMFDDGAVIAMGETVSTLNAFAFGAVGEDPRAAILSGRVAGIDHDLELVELAVGDASLKLPVTGSIKVGDDLHVLVHARDVSLALTQPVNLSIQNILRGTISAINADDQSKLVHVKVRIGGVDVPVQITRAAFNQLALQTGLDVFALIKSVSLMS